MGDINIAHTNNDIKNWKGNLKSAGFLPAERAYVDRWLEAGWVDVHRVHAGDTPARTRGGRSAARRSTTTRAGASTTS
ncbi:hypothetical protein GCM10025876_26070 [Demequina litorisediminis]|uniref:Uncharacterized protein n=1 Tax=Demequina litorisediminis TaxID=1849022 RepID=A0ABQ6IGY0_9MICO|nr:hypothetical protein GCM10025876_26070 [Demequina litorisediminis]